MKFTIRDLQEQFPTNDACLEDIFSRQDRVCACGKSTWYRVKGRMSYACSCGKQIYPLKGTIFEGSTTPLTTWYLVMFLLTEHKSGISAAAVQRLTGVTYKCAWRMCHKIRGLMQEDTKLRGHVEVDETYITPKPWRNSRLTKKWSWETDKLLVGMVSRSGKVRVRHIDTSSSARIASFVTDNLAKGSIVHTDGGRHYLRLTKHGYYHRAYVHWDKFRSGENSFLPSKGQSTQRIENFWSQFKRGTVGVYRNVSARWLQNYANEFAWRYSHRNAKRPMFELLLATI